jgi:RNA polymerase-binding transcription factor DksA
MSDPASAPAAHVAPADLAEIERELAAVEHALARLDDGSYGTCSVCLDPIDDARLAADPTATVCAAHLDVLAP